MAFIDRYSGLALSILSSLIIARLLTPAEIGVYSVAMVLLSFATTVRDMGAGTYMVQEQELTEARIRAVWTIQLGLGLLLALIVALISLPVARFYGEPRMQNIMLVIALNYAVNPIGSLTNAYLIREMRFQNSAVIRFAGNIAGAGISVYLAWTGFGPISLAWGAVANTIVSAIFAAYFRPKHFPWLPGFSEVRHVLSFGTRVTASSIINVLYKGASEMALGKFQGMAATGLYSRASGLVQMFQRIVGDAVGAVSLPWFSMQSRDQGGFTDAFLNSTAYMCALGWSFAAVVLFQAEPLMTLLYGQQWTGAVILVRLLAVALAFSLPSTLCQPALMARGGAGIIARVTAIAATQGVVLAVIGASLNSVGLGVSAIISGAVASILWLRAVSRDLGISWRAWRGPLACSLGVAACSSVGPISAALVFGASPEHSLPPLLLTTVVGAAGFLLGAIIFKHPIRREIALVLPLVNRL
ncbi:MAG: oligosaccharide flippase family protein [Paucibacter sp.]|nr:oligosaccharide flippase family protein [Roseateles sp.]